MTDQQENKPDPKTKQKVYRVGRYTLDVAGRKIFRRGFKKGPKLGPKEFDLMQLLVARRNKVVTFEEMWASVWPDSQLRTKATGITDAEKRLIRETLRTAREKLKDFDDRVEVVMGQGYTFIDSAAAPRAALVATTGPKLRGAERSSESLNPEQGLVAAASGYALLERRDLNSVIQAAEYFGVALEASAILLNGRAQAALLLASGEYSHVISNARFQISVDAAQAALEKATTREERATALTTLGVVELYCWNWRGARGKLRQVIKEFPEYARGHQYYALYLACAGEISNAVAEIQRAQRLAPASAAIHTTAAQLYFFLQNFIDAAKWSHLVVNFYNYPPAKVIYALTLQCASTRLKSILVWFGEKAKISRESLKLEAQKADQALIELVVTHEYPVALGSIAWFAVVHDKSRTCPFEEQALNAGLQSIDPYYRALIAVARGDSGAACEQLAEACSKKSDLLIFMDVDFRLNSLRSLAQFKEIRQQVFKSLPPRAGQKSKDD